MWWFGRSLKSCLEDVLGIERLCAESMVMDVMYRMVWNPEIMYDTLTPFPMHTTSYWACRMGAELCYSDAGAMAWVRCDIRGLEGSFRIFAGIQT